MPEPNTTPVTAGETDVIVSTVDGDGEDEDESLPQQEDKISPHVITNNTDIIFLNIVALLNLIDKLIYG
jgi:hypothetical protein